MSLPREPTGRDEEDALRFGCNAVVLDRHVVLNAGCQALEQALLDRGYLPHPVLVGEFLKAGGATKCMTLLLRRNGVQVRVTPGRTNGSRPGAW